MKIHYHMGTTFGALQGPKNVLVWSFFVPMTSNLLNLNHGSLYLAGVYLKLLPDFLNCVPKRKNQYFLKVPYVRSLP